MDRIALEVADVRTVLRQVAVPEDAAAMKAYMRGQFEFLGVRSPARRRATRSLLRVSEQVDVATVVTFAAGCWREPERELHYVAADVLVANAARLSMDQLPDIVDLVLAESWWDTVDILGPRVIATIVREEPAGWQEVDSWIEGQEMWLARCSLLQQLHYGSATDQAVLFGRCLRRAHDREFFIRKAIGWALRQYARVAPDAVRAFVGDNHEVLSALSLREATRHL